MKTLIVISALLVVASAMPRSYYDSSIYTDPEVVAAKEVYLRALEEATAARESEFDDLSYRSTDEYDDEVYDPISFRSVEEPTTVPRAVSRAGSGYPRTRPNMNQNGGVEQRGIFGSIFKHVAKGVGSAIVQHVHDHYHQDALLDGWL